MKQKRFVLGIHGLARRVDHDHTGYTKCISREEENGKKKAQPKYFQAALNICRNGIFGACELITLDFADHNTAGMLCNITYILFCGGSRNSKTMTHGDLMGAMQMYSDEEIRHWRGDY